MKNNQNEKNNVKVSIVKYVIVGILLVAMVGTMFASLISAIQ